MQFVSVHRTPLTGAITLPGDRHLSRLAIIFGSFSSADSFLTGISSLAEATAALNACRLLGARVKVTSAPGRHDWPGNLTVVIHGGANSLPGRKVINCRRHDRLLALLMARLLTFPGEWELTGGAVPPNLDQSLRQMGMPLLQRRLSGSIQYHSRGIARAVPVSFALRPGEAAVKEALILAAAQAPGVSWMHGAFPLRDHAEHLLSHMGMKMERGDEGTELHGGNPLRPLEFRIPGDGELAAAWLAAAAAAPEAELMIREVTLNSARTTALKILLRMGARIIEKVEHTSCGEARGSLLVKGSRLSSTVIGPAEAVSVLTLLPVLAVAAATARGTTTIRVPPDNFHALSRLWSAGRLLQAFGASVEDTSDALHIRGSGGAPLSAAAVECGEDTDFAMAAAVAGTLARGITRLTATGELTAVWPQSLKGFPANDTNKISRI